MNPITELKNRLIELGSTTTPEDVLDGCDEVKFAVDELMLEIEDLRKKAQEVLELEGELMTQAFDVGNMGKEL